MTSLHSQLCDAITDIDFGHVKVESLVLDMTSAQVNKKGPSGWSPLHFACDRNNKEAVAVLLRVTNICVNSLNSSGMSPLLVAANSGAKDTIKLLLDDDRTDLNAKNRDGVGLEDIVMRAFGSLPQDKEETLGWIKKERERIDKLKKSRIKHENVEMVLKKISKEEEKAKIKIMSNEFEQRVSLSEEAKDENKIIDVPDGNTSKRRSRVDLKNSSCANDEVEKEKDADAEIKLSIFKATKTEEVEGASDSSNDDVEADDNDDNDDLESHLQCPVCLEIMIPPTRIWQCAKSHPICQGCKNKMDQINDRFCPICRSQPIMGRAHLIENIARSLFPSTRPRRISSPATKQIYTGEEHQNTVPSRLQHESINK